MNRQEFIVANETLREDLNFNASNIGANITKMTWMELDLLKNLIDRAQYDLSKIEDNYLLKENKK